MGKKLKRGFYWRGGVVWVRTDAIDKCPRSTGCKDPRAAYLWHAERERLAASPSYAASLTATLGHWIKKTLDVKRAQRSAGTLHMYEVKLGHFARVWGADAPLGTVTPEAVDDYIAQRREEGACNNTIARELTCLRQLLRLAKRGRAYAFDLDDVMPVGFSAEYQPVKRTLRAEDVPRLMAALRNDEERAWVAFALATGADVGEIERARPEDYDRARGVIRIRGTKTTVRDAEVPVLPHVRELLEFAMPHLPLSWPRASKGLGEACARAGLPHLSPKDLRRTAASWLVASGANISLVSRFLRHGSDAMVRKVYGQVTPEQLGSLLRSQTSTETLQSIPRPLGGMADAGDLKGDSPGSCGGGALDNSRTCAPDESRTGNVAGTKTLHRGTVLVRPRRRGRKGSKRDAS